MTDPLRHFRFLDRVVERGLYYLSALLLLTITLAVLYAVVLRYAFNAAPSWSEEAPRVFFLWMTYLGIAAATRRDQNLRVTFIIDRFAPLPRLLVELFMHGAVIVMLAVLFWFNIPIIQLNWSTAMLSTGWPQAVSFVPLSAGCALMMIYQAGLAARAIYNFRLRRLAVR